MRTAKVIGLETLFSFAGFVILSALSIMLGQVSFEIGHATASSAMAGGVIEAFFNLMTWLVVLVAFVAATWLTPKTSKRTS